MASLRCIRRSSRPRRQGLDAESRQTAAGFRQAVVRQRAIVPAHRVRYLAEIADAVRGYHAHTEEQVDRPRAPVVAHRPGHFCRLRQVNRGLRRTAGLEGRPAGPEGQEAARHVAGHGQGLQRRRVCGENPRQGNPHQADHRVAVRHEDSQGHPAALYRRRRNVAFPDARERARLLPLHRRRLRLQARERGPDPDVRRRRRRLPHQPPLQEGLRRHAGATGCPRPSIRSRSTAAIPTSVRTSTARSATPASRSPRSTT